MAINSQNFVHLIGHVGQKPVLKTLPRGTVLAEFSLATNSQYKDRNGNWVKNTEWHRVKAFSKLAETLEKYLDKGSKISVLGSIKYGQWEDKHGQKRTSTDILVESFSFLSSRQDSKDDGYAPRRNDNYPPPDEPPTKKEIARMNNKMAANEARNTPKTEDLPF